MIDASTTTQVSLLEVMAEVSWGASPIVCASRLSPVFALPAATQDTAARQRLSSVLAARGFGSTAPVWPARPFGSDPAQPAWRFRREDPRDPRFYQLESGRLQAVASPPHHVWPSVESFIGEGVQALLEADLLTGRDPSCVDIRLAYLDSFATDAFGGVAGFVERTCGVQLVAPAWLGRHLAPGGAGDTAWSGGCDLAFGGYLQVDVARDPLDQSRVLACSSVSASLDTTPGHAALMRLFAQARGAIHQLQLEMYAADA